MKLLLMGTDSRDGWSLGGKPPPEPHLPGETVLVTSSFDGPLAFVGLKIGPDARVKSIGPRGIRPQGDGTSAKWRIDEIKIDDVAIDHTSVLRVAAQVAPTIGDAACSMRGDFGVGSSVEMRVTNIGTEPAYFYATWELEDLQ